jgi:hypothetical protein
MTEPTSRSRLSRLALLRDVTRMAGHGLHPDRVVEVAMWALDVDPLPGSHVVSNERAAQIETELNRAIKLRKKAGHAY